MGQILLNSHMRKYFSLFFQPKFIVYLLGSGLSRIGDGIYLVVLAWFALSHGHTTTRLATIIFVYTLTQLLCVIPAGWLSDLSDRYYLLILADFLRLLALILLSVQQIAGHLATIIIFGIIFGIGSSLASPNEKPLLKSFVNKDQIPQANSVTSIVYPLCRRIIGPLLGGIIVSVLPYTYGFGIDAITFLVSIICLFLLKQLYSKSLKSHDKEISSRANSSQKVSFTQELRQPWVILCISGTLIGLILNIGPILVLVPSLVKKISNAHGYGIVISMGGLASIIFSLIYGFIHVKRTYCIAFTFYAIASSALILFGIAHSVPMLSLAAIVDEGFATMGSLIIMTATMHKGDDTILGRLFAILSFAELAAAPISIFLTEFLLRFHNTSSLLISTGIFGFTAMLAMAIISLKTVDFR